jgi:hypothetical protein
VLPFRLQVLFLRIQDLTVALKAAVGPWEGNMELWLERRYKKEKYTIGVLYIDNELFCNTLEDKVRDLPNEKKVPGATAIPAGRYRVVMSWSNRFKRVMPELLGVPYFEGIRIHGGNTAENTEGCILLGKNTEVGVVTNSGYYVDKLEKKLLATKEKIFITIV